MRRQLRRAIGRRECIAWLVLRVIDVGIMQQQIRHKNRVASFDFDRHRLAVVQRIVNNVPARDVAVHRPAEMRARDEPHAAVVDKRVAERGPHNDAPRVHRVVRRIVMPRHARADAAGIARDKLADVANDVRPNQVRQIIKAPRIPHEVI